MILPTTLQSVSTSKIKRNAFCVVLAVVVLSVSSGCSDQRPILTKASGYVNLDTLVRASPGWKNVAQLTSDITAIGAARTAVKPQGFDSQLATLPSIAGLTTQGTIGLGSPEYQELWRRANRDLLLLAKSRAISRDQQIERLSETWSLAASDEYDATQAAITQKYAQRIEGIYASQTAERISLDLQIAQLKKILLNWQASAPPPTPKLNAAKAELSAKQAQLQTLAGSLAGEVAAAKSDRDDQLAQARSKRDGFVPAQVRAERARLEKIDSDHLSAERLRLSEQIRQLLTESSAAQRDSILKLKALKPYTESMAVVTAAPSATSGANSAIEALVNQRSRREAFLYDTVRAAALAIAEKKHWNIEFVKNGSTRTDLTGKIAAIMAARSTD